MIAADTVTAKTSLPPFFQPKSLSISQPQLKEKSDNENQAEKL